MSHGDRANNGSYDEVRCIWMDGGQVSYKLCDMEFDCERCPFDSAMRNRYGKSAAISLQDVHAISHSGEHLDAPATQDAVFEEMLDQLLLPFTRVRLPEDRLYTREHFWMKEESQDVWRVGIDHLGVIMLSSIAGIVYAQAPAYIQRGAPCLWIVHPDGTLALGAPVNGTVLYGNKSMGDCPYLLQNFPYGDGWLMAMTPENIHAPGAGTMEPDKAAEHYSQQGEVLRVALRDAYRLMQPAAGVTMHDGGLLHRSVPEMLGLARYYQIIHKFYQVP